MNDIIKNSKWYLMTIDDPLGLPGESILNVLNLLTIPLKLKYVIINDINGAAENGLIHSLQNKENIILELEEILNVLKKVNQFDWGDFFLFCQKPMNWDNPNDYNYPKLISQTDTTVRAVDDQYIYIYTSHQKVVNLIKEKYTIENVKTGSLDELDYPY